jgi:hypothetical protein
MKQARSEGRHIQKTAPDGPGPDLSVACKAARRAVDAEEDARLVSVPEGVPLLRVHGAPSGLAGD